LSDAEIKRNNDIHARQKYPIFMETDSL